MPHPGKKLLQTPVCIFLKNKCGTVGIHTPLLSAVTLPAVLFDHHMAEFTALKIISRIQLSAETDRAAYRIAQREIYCIRFFIFCCIAGYCRCSQLGIGCAVGVILNAEGIPESISDRPETYILYF